MNTKAYKFAEIKDEAGNNIGYLNTLYIVDYRYVQQANETLIDILGEDRTRHVPGDQTKEIASTINLADNCNEQRRRKRRVKL